MYGIYFGKDAAVAVIDEFSIEFLRDGDRVISILRHKEHSTVGVVVGSDNHSSYCLSEYKSDDTVAAEALKKHHSYSMTFQEDGQMIYKLDDKEYHLQLAEHIRMSDFERSEADDSMLSVAEKMRKWNVQSCFNMHSQGVRAGIDTERYSVLFMVNTESGTIYCRMGQNGYCDKGWAMLSTICLRVNECRMIADNTDAVKPYIPNEDCFVTDGCAFPRDGGWYWSVREVTEDTIYLNGCGGETYEIHKP